ncbi:HNH endonuclease signature motif containing protein [Humibacter ginsengisoli]
MNGEGLPDAGLEGQLWWVDVIDESSLVDEVESSFRNASGASSPADRFVSSVVTVSGEAAIRFALDAAVGSQTMVNIEAARQMFAIREAFQLAREDPRIYVPVGITERDPEADEVDFALRSVAFDLAHRLHVSENVVRNLAWEGDVLTTSLPRLRDLFCSGRISPQHVRAAVDACTGLPDAVLGTYDERLAGIAERVTPGVLGRRARLLRERLCADTLERRHEEARKRRRVCVEPAEDGMGWLSVYGPVLQIAQAEARLTAEARRLRALPGENRTLDQLRADLTLQLLTTGGTTCDGTATCGGAATRDGTATRSHEGDATGVAPVKTGVQPFVLIDADGRFAELLGYGPIPPSVAGKALRDAPSFRKVLADPIRPAQLNLDTKRYRPTPDQRTWLTLRYGLDEDAAPYLPVGVTTGAEIDHVIERQHGGPTNVTNLAPLKPRLHRLKTVTRIRLDPKPDGGIRVRTPTGYDSDPPPF